MTRGQGRLLVLAATLAIWATLIGGAVLAWMIIFGDAT